MNLCVNGWFAFPETYISWFVKEPTNCKIKYINDHIQQEENTSQKVRWSGKTFGETFYIVIKMYVEIKITAFLFFFYTSQFALLISKIKVYKVTGINKQHVYRCFS